MNKKQLIKHLKGFSDDAHIMIAVPRSHKREVWACLDLDGVHENGGAQLTASPLYETTQQRPGYYHPRSEWMEGERK